MDIASIFATPIVLVILAIVAWRVQLNILARKTAFDYIMQTELSKEHIEVSTAAQAFLQSNSGDNSRILAANWSRRKLTEAELADCYNLFSWLNNREFVAIAILNGTMHQATYANWWGPTYISEWAKASEFVTALRETEEGDPLLFIYFEELATSEKFRKLSDVD